MSELNRLDGLGDNLALHDIKCGHLVDLSWRIGWSRRSKLTTLTCLALAEMAEILFSASTIKQEA